MKFQEALLSSVCDISMGQAPKGSSYNTDGEGFPLIAGAGDFGDTTPEPGKWTDSPTKLSVSGDIILCIRATIGDLNWSDKEYCLGRGVAGLRADEGKLYQNFLWQWLHHSTHVLKSKGRGATFLQISKSDIASLQISLPPLPEQKRIAAILDAADALRAKRRESLGQLDTLVQSTFLDMLGDPGTNPKRWRVVRLEELCERIVDCPHSTPKYSESRTELYCIRSSDIHNGKLDFSKTRHVDSNVYKERIRRHEPEAGEVVYTREGGRLGLAALIPPNKKVCLGQRMMLFRAAPNVSMNTFIWGLLHSNSIYRKIVDMSGGGAAPRVNIKQLKGINSICPPLREQRQFAQFYEVIEKQMVRERAHLEELNILFAALQSRAFNGEL